MFHWSIDLGGLVTAAVTIIGFIALFVRSRSDLDNLKASSRKLTEDMETVKVDLAKLEERVANWIVARMHNPRS